MPAAAGAAVAPCLPLLFPASSFMASKWPRKRLGAEQLPVEPLGAPDRAASTAEWASVSICRSTRMAKSMAPTKPICYASCLLSSRTCPERVAGAPRGTAGYCPGCGSAPSFRAWATGIQPALEAAGRGLGWRCVWGARTHLPVSWGWGMAIPEARLLRGWCRQALALASLLCPKEELQPVPGAKPKIFLLV